MTSGLSPLVLGMKNAVIYGIMVGTQTALFLPDPQSIFRHTQMIQPLFCDLFTGTLFHRFLDIIARYIGEQTIYPYADFIFILILELSLTVDGPA